MRTLLLLTASLLFSEPSTYVGEWSSGLNSGVGALKIVLAPDANKCEFSFQLPGNEPMKAQGETCTIDGDKIRTEYKFEAQGYTLKSKLTGTVANGVASGTYETVGPDDSKVDSGSWKTKKQ